MGTKGAGNALKNSGWLFILGILLFSGSLYVVSLAGIRWMGAVTPIGGLAFLAGWYTLRLGSPGGTRFLAPRAYSLAVTREARERRESATWVDWMSPRLARPAFSASPRAAILLGRTAGRSLSADRSPTSLGIHEGSFETLAFFAELQTIFLDPTIDFPP